MKISRRSVLHISGLAAAALALTGCSAAGSAALGGKLPGLLKSLTKKGETAASSEAASDMAVTPPPEGEPLVPALPEYDADSIPEVGPLRSGRDQFLQLLMPWNILYYHDGESIFCTQFVSVYGYSGLNIGGKSYFKTPIHPIISHRNNRGRDVAYEHTEFTSGKEICKAASDAGISLYAPSEGTFFHFADYRTDEVNKLKGEPSAKKITIVHSASYRTSFSYSALSHTYAMQMYNSSKKATENTVDELTGEQLTFENIVVCFADMDAYAGDSHDVQEVQYIKGGDAYLFTRGGVQVGRWEKTYPTNPLKLYTKSGEEMTLNRGKTYFALVDNDELSNFSYQ